MTLIIEILLKVAGRFTNSIILQTSREFGTVPTYMTNPKVDIFTQFLRYPTVFGNTVLKNFARDAITDPTANAPKIAAFAVMATNVAKATNYWRTSEENRERITQDGEDWRDTLKAFQRVGLLGPMEYGVRVAEGMAYGQNPLLATAGVGGPVINDIIGLAFYNRGLLETAARKAPLIGTKNIFERTVGDIMEEYTGFRDPYTPMQKAAKEATKSIRSVGRSVAETIAGKEQETGNRLLRNMGGPINVDPYTGQPYEERQTFVTGGLVEGEDVPFTKEDPAERINKFTGEPYQKEMDRLGFKDGGQFNMTRFLEHLKDREGYRDDVYLDTLKKPTAGVGHLLTKEEQQMYQINDKVPTELIEEWLQKDSKKAVTAAFKQAQDLGIQDGAFIEALGSVNFQLGTNWKQKFPSAYKALKEGNYQEAINQISTGSGVEGQSKWKEQTPTRVEDFKVAIEKLFK